MVIKNLRLGSANPNKKDWSFLFINLLIVIAYGCILFTSSFNFSQKEFDASLKQKKDYQSNFTDMKTTIDSISNKKIDLATDLPLLQEKYTYLMKLSLTNSDHSGTLLRRKKEIVRYLGDGFYQHISKIPNNIRFSKVKTIVTFGQFNSETRLIDVNLFITFAISNNGKNQKSGFMQASAKYDLLNQKSQSFKIDFETVR